MRAGRSRFNGDHVLATSPFARRGARADGPGAAGGTRSRGAPSSTAERSDRRADAPQGSTRGRRPDPGGVRGAQAAVARRRPASDAGPSLAGAGRVPVRLAQIEIAPMSSRRWRGGPTRRRSAATRGAITHPAAPWTVRDHRKSVFEKVGYDPRRAGVAPVSRAFRASLGGALCRGLVSRREFRVPGRAVVHRPGEVPHVTGSAREIATDQLRVRSAALMVVVGGRALPAGHAPALSLYVPYFLNWIRRPAALRSCHRQTCLPGHRR